MDELVDTMDTLRQQLAGACTGQESLALVKRAQSRFRAISTLKSMTSGSRNTPPPPAGDDMEYRAALTSNNREQGAEITSHTGKKKLRGSRPLSGVTTPIIKGTSLPGARKSKK